MKVYFKKIFIIFLLSFIFFLALDAIFGKYVYKKFIKEDLVDVDVIKLSAKDEVYDHTFSKNFKGIVGWGNKRYEFCSDNNGFRISCSKKNKNQKKYDIGFLGDSFTEGTGLVYEDTFVGIIEKKLPNKKIANLAVSSYSPAIYYTKIKKLLETGYQFNEIIVFLDISDLVDDSLCYQVSNNKIIRKKTYDSCFNNLNSQHNKLFDFFEKNFKLSKIFIDFILKNDPIDKKIIQDQLNHSRSEWTYNYKKINFQNLDYDKTSSISLKHMQDLYLLLDNRSIKLSVAVYPWPGTLRFDNPENTQVKLWRDFCKNNCSNFYNFMPKFFSEIEKKDFYHSYKKFYIEGDIHFNRYGNEIIANEFILKYKN